MTRLPFLTPGEEKEYLASCGVRPLNHRVAVLRYLVENPVHPSAEEIYEGLKNHMSSISKTTVYNVLNLLSDKNAIKRITIDKHELRYDANTQEHIHFLCTSCKSVEDLHHVAFPSVEIGEEYEIEEVDIEIKGLCPSCAQKKRANNWRYRP
ncbi:MAG: Fur family transcriptional regulator [Sphaerochaetaceae bacterium]|jgi:Fur family peroxide stress response transcriptional regulator